MYTDRPSLTRPRVGDEHPRHVVIHRHRRGLWRALLLGLLVCVPVLAWPASASAAAAGFGPPLPPPLTVVRGFAAPAQPWLPGNRGVQMMMSKTAEQGEFMVVSYWDSIEAIKGYAGEEYTKVHDLPRDNEFLIDHEPLVRHFDLPVNFWQS